MIDYGTQSERLSCATYRIDVVVWVGSLVKTSVETWEHLKGHPAPVFIRGYFG